MADSTPSGYADLYPEAPTPEVVWELRTAWGACRETIVILTSPRAGVRPAVPGVMGAPADRARVRGYVTSVAATGAYALLWDGVGETHIPCALVADVRRPYFANPEDGLPVTPPPPRVVIVLDNQLDLADGMDFEWEPWSGELFPPSP